MSVVQQAKPKRLIILSVQLGFAEEKAAVKLLQPFWGNVSRGP